MTHNFRDRDIDEIFVITSPNNTLLHISYLGEDCKSTSTEETFYTRADLVRLIDIIDGKEEGLVVVKAQPQEIRK